MTERALRARISCFHSRALEGNFVNIVDAREGDPRLASQPSANGHRWTLDTTAKGCFPPNSTRAQIFFPAMLVECFVFVYKSEKQICQQKFKNQLYTYLAERNRNNYEVNEQKSLQAIFPAD